MSLGKVATNITNKYSDLNSWNLILTPVQNLSCYPWEVHLNQSAICAALSVSKIHEGGECIYNLMKAQLPYMLRSSNQDKW